MKKTVITLRETIMGMQQAVITTRGMITGVILLVITTELCFFLLHGRAEAFTSSPCLVTGVRSNYTPKMSHHSRDQARKN